MVVFTSPLLRSNSSIGRAFHACNNFFTTYFPELKEYELDGRHSAFGGEFTDEHETFELLIQALHASLKEHLAGAISITTPHAVYYLGTEDIRVSVIDPEMIIREGTEEEIEEDQE